MSIVYSYNLNRKLWLDSFRRVLSGVSSYNFLIAWELITDIVFSLFFIRYLKKYYSSTYLWLTRAISSAFLPRSSFSFFLVLVLLLFDFVFCL